MKDNAAALRAWADALGDRSDPVLYEEWQRDDQAMLRSAADEIERLRIRQIPDGTPVADLLVELDELRASVAHTKRTLRTIRNLCNAPHWNTGRRWLIRDLAATND